MLADLYGRRAWSGLLIFLIFFSPLFVLAEDIMSSDSSPAKGLSPVFSPPSSTPHVGQARGIILKFNRWPTKKEKKLILKTSSSAHFQKIEELELMMTFIFTWNTWKPVQQAQALCQSFSAFSFVKYCEIDSELPSDQAFESSVEPNPDPFNQMVASMNEALSYSQEGDDLIGSVLLNQPINSFSSTATGNLKTCGIVPHQMNLKSGKLSDYWAQEMIGSDLAKELFASAPPLQKKLVAVMDVPTGDHDVKVKNLISGNGRHAVLPNLGSNLNMYRGDTASKYTTQANSLLTGVRTQCGSAP